MCEGRFIEFFIVSREQYVQSQFECGIWGSKQEAYRQVNVWLETNLPMGMKTPNHYFYDLVCLNSDQAVGGCWFKIDSTQKIAFVYYIEVHEQYRRCGYAREAISQLEGICDLFDCEKILLNVFEHNVSARELYKSLGFVQLSSNMLKRL